MTAKQHYMAGLGKLGAGDMEGATRCFQDALLAEVSFYIAHLGWAQALDRLGRVDEAIEQVQNALLFAPNDPLVHTSLSRLYQQKGMILEAEQEMALSRKLSERT